MNLEAVALLGTQVVSGTNYMYLAKGTPVTQNPTTSWKIVVVYKDLKGNSEIKEVKDFNFEKYTNNDIQYNKEDATGSWKVNTEETKVEFDKDIKTIYEDAINNYEGIKLSKIAYLGSQQVSGTNYAFLNLATTTTKESSNFIAVVTVYSDLDNNNEVNSISYVDLAEFN